MSDIYKLTLKQKSGLLTELQSDTIFGHFCWRMKEMQGEDRLIEFLKLFKERNPVFTLSNSFFERDGEIFLPNPLLPLRTKKEEKTKEERIKSFLNYKDSKKTKFLTFKQFNASISGDIKKLEELILEEKRQEEINKIEKKEYKSKQPKYTEDLRTSVEISRETFSSKERQLFSYSPLYIEEELVDPKKQLFTETRTVIFIKVIDKIKFDEFNCENILKEVFNIGFGKKKSSGYGEFQVLGFDKFDRFHETEDSNGFISLSNYLPSNKDKLTIEGSYYDLNIKYGKLGEEYALSENPFKKPIVLMTPGSSFKTENKKDFYGRCTNESEICEYKKEVLQNGIAFTLKIKI